MIILIKIINANKDNNFLTKLLERNQFDNEEINRVVKEIVDDVRKRKDKAIVEYTAKFDKVKVINMLVTEEEIEYAFANIDTELHNALLKAKDNIESFHNEQIRESYTIKDDNGSFVGQIVNPIERVGIYVPGGKAAYPSTVLMNTIPAKIAGVKEIIMVTPPTSGGKIKNAILVAAAISGVNKIYKVGGAQAIAALAYGTESIPKVSKIVGPGNIYVAMAKKRVSGYVGIDMIAGPSEILIIADKTANPRYIAADLISQAEHDEMAASILITTSEALATKVVDELYKQIKTLERKDIITKSLESYGQIIITSTMEKSIEIANEIAPEHLEIITENPIEISKKITNAGAIFLGEYTPEPVGDYYAGPNHTLPTSATAKFSSPLGVEDFIKKTSLIYYNKVALKEAKDSIIRIATDEGLTGHANSVKIRFEDEV